jgi:hypothetical protein
VDRLTIQETGEILVATSTDAGDYILQLAGDVLVTQTNGGSSIFKDIANLRTVTINPANRMIDGNGGLSLQLVDSGSITMCRGGGSVLVATSTEVAGGYKLQVAGDSLFGTNGTPGLNVTADRINSIKDGNWAIMRNGGDRLSFFTNSTYEYIGSVLCQVRNSAGETYIATDTDAGDYKLQVAGNEYITGYSHYPNNGTFLKLVDAVTGIVDVASGCFFFGPYSGNTTRTGTYNQSFGHNCLYSLTSGTGNFGAGTAVLGGVTTGGFNTVIGYTAGQFLATGSNNTGFGCNALNSTTGDGNTAVGRGALLPQVEGSNNVAVGLSAGRYYTGDVANKLANSCTYLGYNTKALGASGTNEIVIGANAIGAGSNTVTIGDTNITKTVVRSLRVTDADTADGSLFAGSTRAVRIGHGSTDSSIEGVDPTGTSTYLPLRLGGSSVSIGYYGGETIIVSNQGVLIGTSTAPVAGATGSYLLAVNSSAWIASDVCALSFTDRTPAPSSLTEAYAIVESHESKDGKLDHSRLHPAAWGTRNVSRLTGRKVTKHIEATEEEPAREIEEDETEIVSEPDQSGRNLSKTVSALAMVAKQQAAEIAALKAELAKITKH